MSFPFTALPSEPLLEPMSQGAQKLPVAKDVDAVLADMAQETDVSARCRILYGILRKQMGQGHFKLILEAIVSLSASDRSHGVGALSALLAVQGPGEIAIDRVREFRNLHRVVSRLRASGVPAASLSKSEAKLLADLKTSDERLDSIYDVSLGETLALPHPLDFGPSRVCRRAFGALVADLEARSDLDRPQLMDMVSLARLELKAAEIRASQLAESINPYSSRHVSTVMPVLSSVDTEVRDISAFLDLIEKRRQASLFHQLHPAIEDHLEQREQDIFEGQLAQHETLAIVRRLFHLVGRNPLPYRTLAFYMEHILCMARVLHSVRLRRTAPSVLDAVIVALEFVQDGVLRLPMSPSVRKALMQADLDGVEPDEDGMRVVFDPAAARALSLPFGYPLAATEPVEAIEPEPGVHGSVKELVMENMNNTSILLGLLKNEKVVSTPGIVALVVTRCRNARVMEEICTNRRYHSGFANKDVPLAILKSPMRMPIKTIRKFINVRYIAKVELRRMAVDRSSVRREIADEVEAYLASLT